VTEQYYVHNVAQPAHTQYNPDQGFEVVLPPDATLDGAEARRPTGLPTQVTLKPGHGNGHYQFDFPIQPDEGEKDTFFRLSYHVSYSGTYTFHPQIQMASDNVAVLLPLSIKFKAESGSGYQPVQQDPGIQTLLVKNVSPGTPLDFTVSGTGSMPREQQGAQGQQPQTQSVPSGPGGGIGEPINTPDPLSKYKWWILGAMGLLLATVAGFLLRRPATATGVAVQASSVTTPTARASRPAAAISSRVADAAPVAPLGQIGLGGHNATLLHVLKEEMFAIESEKLSGTLSQDDYAEQKSALETVLKRALKRKA